MIVQRTTVFWRVTALCFFLVGSDSCLAQSPYQLESKREWVLLGTGAVLGVGALVALGGVDPLTEDEIARLDPGDINDFDRKAIEPFRETGTGDAFLYASYLLPLTFLTYTDTRRDWKTLGVIWAEATLIQWGITGLAKGIAQRIRPYAYDPETSLEKKTTTEARLSFYSGHTVGTATNSFLVAKVFSDYLANTKVEALIWTGAVLYPALTGFLRRDSGHHFRTDVFTGYCIGALIGYFVPALHKVRDDGKISLRPARVDGGAGVGLHCSF